MNVYTAEQPDAEHESIVRLRALLNMDAVDSIRFSYINQELIVEGQVPSYEAKCMIDKAAQAAGLNLENYLRVVPGVF